LSSVQIFISATSAINTIGPWYTSHILTRGITASFIPFFLTADFIGYPTYYFADFQTQVTLTSSNYLNSPGIKFYGEGHTETINLSAKLNPGSQRYIWYVGTPNTIVAEATSVDLSGARSRTRIPTEIGSYPQVPIFLYNTHNLILSTGPTVYYPEELSGVPAYYPFYASTTNVAGEELSNNNKFKQSIQVLSYETPLSSFTPGISGVVSLPESNQPQTYTASLVVAVSGRSVIGNCYDKYGLLWKWSTFSECSAFTSFQKLSSWANTECLLLSGPGKYPKKWRNEGALSATIFTPTPVIYTTSNLTWTLSTPDWDISEINPYNITN
jgi:hypothetical protein